MTTCPHAHDRRKIVRPGEADGPAIEEIDGIWHVRSVPLVREVLRSGDTTQAGFNSEMATGSTTSKTIREPILFMDGPEHRDARSKIARYFAPKTVSRRYRELMEVRADELVAGIEADLSAGRRVDLSTVALRYAVEVAAAVIGLTNSNTTGMARRLERLFTIPAVPARPHSPDGTPIPRPPAAPLRLPDALASRLPERVRARIEAAVPDSLPTRLRDVAEAGILGVQSATRLPHIGDFYLRDVLPAVRARRRTPDEDVISHLIEQGYTDREIVTECLTYGAAGMVTTREFISVVAWHLLGDPDLRARFLASEEADRYRLLHEILRLEPVVGHLYRRAGRDLVLGEGDEQVHIPAGAVLDCSIRAANADPETIDHDPLGLCPERDLPRGVRPEVMSFGDGYHKCPGNSLAIQETDILLTRLLALPITLEKDPDLGWLDLIAGYELRDVTLAPQTSPAS